MIRVRLTPGDARYGGGLVAGAKVMEIVGDLVTELAIRDGGDEGLCVAYESVEFLAPLHAGDFIEGRAAVSAQGRSSRGIEAEVRKVIAAREGSRAKVLDPPELVARARGTVIVATPGRAEKPTGGEDD